jgi:membrane-bound ClpP family serine protease
MIKLLSHILFLLGFVMVFAEPISAKFGAIILFACCWLIDDGTMFINKR